MRRVFASSKSRTRVRRTQNHAYTLAFALRIARANLIWNVKIAIYGEFNLHIFRSVPSMFGCEEMYGGTRTKNEAIETRERWLRLACSASHADSPYYAFACESVRRERNLFNFQHLSTTNHQLWNLHLTKDVLNTRWKTQTRTHTERTFVKPCSHSIRSNHTLLKCISVEHSFAERGMEILQHCVIVLWDLKGDVRWICLLGMSLKAIYAKANTSYNIPFFPLRLTWESI